MNYFRQKQEKSLFVSPEVISNTPNRNLDTPKVFFVTLGVFCFYAERQNVPPFLPFLLGMPLYKGVEAREGFLSSGGLFGDTGWLLPNKGWLLPNKAPYSY